MFHFIFVRSFDYIAFVVSGWDYINQFNHISWMAVVTPTDRPRQVYNNYVIEV